MIRFRMCPIPSSSGKDPSPTPLPALLPRPLVSGVWVRDDGSDLSASDILASRREREELLNEEVVDMNRSGTRRSGRFETSFAVAKVYCIALTEGARSSVSSNGRVFEFGGPFRGQA